MSRSEPSRAQAFAAVAAGGAIGALARWGVDVAIEATGRHAAWATLSVNVAGCLLMGLLVSYVLSHPDRHGLWRPFLGIGVLGGFTTFSAFAVDTVALILGGSPAWALAYLVASVAGSLAAVWAGFAAGRALRRRSTS
ncbi:MAG: fluoride efflux transporter FluC [Candidatus Nanopelagicales bacterium]